MEGRNMFCKYCGNQMDEDAVFCSKCGKNVGNQPALSQTTTQFVTQRKLVVQRKKQIYGCAVQLAIMIDEVERGRIGNGGKITLPISSEAHALSIKQDNFGGKYQSKTYVIPQGAGDVYAYLEPTIFNGKWVITMECM